MKDKKIIRLCEQEGFNVSINTQDNGKYYELSQYTPLGEDWSFTIWDNFEENLQDYVENYDAEEEAEFLIENRGNYGIPTSIRALLEDAEWKGEQIDNLLEVILKEEKLSKKRYAQAQAQLREEAINYQLEVSNKNMYMSEIAEKTNYFYKKAKKYGLVKEFRENGII